MEELWIEKSKEGDESAFAELVKRNQGKILSHILSIVKDESIAEDLTQETFISAYTHIRRFQGRSSFSTWLWRIAHNKALSWLREQKREASLEYKDELYAADFPEEESFEMDGVKEMLTLLPLKQRQAFEMYEMDHLTQKEIASRLGIPPGTVRSRIHYARKALRFFLKGKKP